MFRRLISSGNKMRVAMYATPLLMFSLLSADLSKVDIPQGLRPKIQQELMQRIEQYKLQEMNDCRSKWIAMAGHDVDSSIIAQFALLQIPYNRPSRPLKPGELPSKDTVAVRPLFSLAQIDSLLQDSILISLDSLLDQMELRAGIQRDTSLQQK
ncbi:MAG: hypothetical protein ABIV51_10690 [Saprospiraceae bacterium]